MIHYIIEGDIYITNMTQQLTIEREAASGCFYDLRKNNPSPFGGYMDYGDFQIVSASPERFLKDEKGSCQYRDRLKEHGKEEQLRRRSSDADRTGEF